MFCCSHCTVEPALHAGGRAVGRAPAGLRRRRRLHVRRHAAREHAAAGRAARAVARQIHQRLGGERACRRKMVRVDGAVGKCVLQVAPGASVELVQRVAAGPAAGDGRRARDSNPLTVAYEDDHLAIVVKPAGMPIQGRYGATGAREKFAGSLVPSRRADAQPLWRPQHVHRLDAPTSGLLVVAKTGAALRTLSACFAARLVRKKYVAVVAGALPPAAPPSTIDAPLSGKHARTRWRCVARYPSLKFGSVSWLELWPHTGRTHQLRRHCAGRSAARSSATPSTGPPTARGRAGDGPGPLLERGRARAARTRRRAPRSASRSRRRRVRGHVERRRSGARGR